MAKHLTRDLDRLQQQLLGLANRVEEAADRATQAVFDRDAVAARAVIEADEVVDALENRVQEECLKLLALHQPVSRYDPKSLAGADLQQLAGLLAELAPA